MLSRSEPKCGPCRTPDKYYPKSVGSITCSKLKIGTVEQGVKYVQS